MEALRRRGLTSDLVAETTRDIKAAKSLEPPAEDDLLEELERAAKEQRAAYEQLNLIYNDWAETLRSELGYHARIKLGISAYRRRRSATEPETTEEERDDE